MGGKLFAQYLVDVKSRIEVFSEEGTSEGPLALPGVGTVAGLSGREDGDELFYAFTSALQPTTIYRYDLKTRTTAAFDPPPRRLRRRGLRDDPGLLHLEGRHARAHVRDREEGPRPRR